MRAVAIFPGQGSEYPGMLRNIRDLEITREIFTRINNAAGADVMRLALEGPGSELQKPLYAQLAVFGTSACYWNLLRGSADFSAVAGHSLGFYSALYASGVLDLDECLFIIKAAQEAIEEAFNRGSGSMAAVFGIREKDAVELCSRTGNVFVSHVNTSTQIVVSGMSLSVREACRKAADFGALDSRELPIPYPLHSPLMSGTEERIRARLGSLVLREPLIPVVSHLDGNVVDVAGIAEVLCRQLSLTVRWKDAVVNLAGPGTCRFHEIGPSDVLSKLVRWLVRDAETVRAEETVSCFTA